MFAIQPIHARKPGTNCQPFGSGPYGQESRTREGAPEAENACSSELTDESAERFRFRVRRGSVNVVCGCGTVLCLVCLPFSVLPFCCRFIRNSFNGNAVWKRIRKKGH